MTYVLTFTNDTDSYSQNLQLEGIREALLNDCEIHKIDEEISFEKIDDAVEEAIKNGCDNFMCLCEDEDVSLLKEGLDSEYGRFFERIDVVEEQFYRLREADNAAPPAGNTQQPPANNEPPVNGNAVTMVNVIMFNINYPFADLLNLWLNSATSLQLPKPKAGEYRNILCDCAAVAGQHLKIGAVRAVAEGIPGADFETKFSSFDSILSKSEATGKGSAITCGNYTDQTKILHIFEYCLKWPNVNTINLYAPKGFSTVQTGPLKLRNGKSIQINVFPNLPTFDSSKNETVYEALKQLVEGKKNNYKGMSSRTEEAIKAELKNEAKGLKDQKGFNEAMKQLEKDPYSAEVETGWPKFVSDLIDQTKIFDQEGDTKENLGEKQTEQYHSAVLEKFKAGVKAEVKAWTDFLDNAIPASKLVGFFKDLAHDIKNFDKLAAKFQKDDRRKSLEGLLRTDAYLVVRKAFSESLNDFNAENFQKNCMNYTLNEEKCKAFIGAQQQANSNINQYK